MKTLTIKGKCDGFGAQYQAIMSGIAYCNYMNYIYIHTPLQKIAHNGNPAKLNEFIGVPCSDEINVNIIVKCCGEVHFSKTPDIYYNSHDIHEYVSITTCTIISLLEPYVLIFY